MDAGTLLLGAGIALGSASLGVISEATKGWIVSRHSTAGKRKAFQHRTAIELQETLFRESEQVNRFYFWTFAHYRESRHWGRAGIPPGQENEEWGLPRTRATLLIERLDDGVVRRQVQELLDMGTSMLTAESFEDATRLYEERETKLKAVSALLGRIIRESWPD